MEGRVQHAPQAAFAPGDAREDWTILRALSDKLGATLPFDTFTQLRSALYADYPHFQSHDLLPEQAWADFGHAGEISKEAVEVYVKDFYLTNPIARASAVMAECSAAFSQDKKLEAGDGTNG